jgi:hypothetical protein
MSAANRLSLAAKSAEAADQARNKDINPQLIATAFGNLTHAEIRDWEKMLGRRLLRLPDQASEN